MRTLPGTGYNSTNALQSIMQWFGRQVDLKDLKNNWDQVDEYGKYTHYNWIQSFHANPYWTLNKNTNSYDRNRFYGKTSLYIKPTDWLKFEGRMGLDITILISSLVFYGISTIRMDIFVASTVR